jgi:hypothetical protein
MSTISQAHISLVQRFGSREALCQALIFQGVLMTGEKRKIGR